MRTGKYIAAFILFTIGLAIAIKLVVFREHAVGKEKEGDRITQVIGTVDDNEPIDKVRAGKIEENKTDFKVDVIEKYKLPEILVEISGLASIGENRFACVQDEKGVIFIYNTKNEEIEREIKFAGDGDFEGLTIAGEDALVLRSDGKIFQVVNYLKKDPETLEHKTHLSSKQNCEGIIYDSKNNRLLVTIKESEPDTDSFKGIYEMSLKDFKMPKNPAYKINLEDPIIKDLKRKKDGSQVMPSGIAIHPLNRDMYIIEGVKPKLLILNSSGKIKSVTELDKKDFNQPEGVSFSPEGQLYISNEGGKGDGNILKAKISGN